MPRRAHELSCRAMYSFWASPHTCPLPRFSLFGSWTLPCLPLSWSLFGWVSFQPLQECEPCQRGDAQDTQEGTGGRLVHSHSSPELCRGKGHGVCFERRVPILHPALRPGLVLGTPPGPSATWNLKEALLLCPSSAAFPGVENLRPSSAT